MDCRGFSGSQSFFFRIRSVVKRQSKSLAKPPSPSGQASDGIYRILSKGTGLTAMPRPSSGKPLKVFLSVMIESITDISEVNMDMTLTICIHQAWHDHRNGWHILTNHLKLKPYWPKKPLFIARGP